MSCFFPDERAIGAVAKRGARWEALAYRATNESEPENPLFTVGLYKTRDAAAKALLRAVFAKPGAPVDEPDTAGPAPVAAEAEPGDDTRERIEALARRLDARRDGA